MEGVLFRYFDNYRDGLRGLFLRIIISGVTLILIGNAYAADTDAAKSSPSGEQQIQDIKKEDNAFDQIQKQYITRLERINADLRNKHSAFGKNYVRTTLIRERMKSHLRWGYGQIPSAILKSLQDLADEKTALAAAIERLEEEKADLRGDIRSFYDGKIPEWLTRRWDKEEKAYDDYVENNYLEVRWLLASRKWSWEEEKAFGDYIEEYHRLRQKQIEKDNLR